MFPSPSTATFRIEFPVSPTWFQTIREFLITASMNCGFDECTAGRIAMATDEALSNIYRHGYQGDVQGRAIMQVNTEISPHPRINIQIDDKALQVNIASIIPRDIDDIRPGGLGLHLIKTIMDEVEWTTLDTGGMRLTMIKTYIETQDEKSPNGEQVNE